MAGHVTGMRPCDVLSREPRMNHFLTEHEVAQQLRISVGSLRRWRVERGGPPSSRLAPSSDIATSKLGSIVYHAAAIRAGTENSQRRGNCKARSKISGGPMAVYKQSKSKYWWYKFTWNGERSARARSRLTGALPSRWKPLTERRSQKARSASVIESRRLR